MYIWNYILVLKWFVRKGKKKKKPSSSKWINQSFLYLLENKECDMLHKEVSSLCNSGIADTVFCLVLCVGETDRSGKYSSSIFIVHVWV